MKIIPIILSGGSGTRLWPLSRKLYPKQYLPLTGQQTMLQQTVVRLEGLANIADPVVVCNSDHRFLVAEQLHQIGFSNPTIILEPIGRNTAPAITAAAIHLKNNNIEGYLLVLSADHMISDIVGFQQAICQALEAAQQDNLITFGIVPDSAKTGYGYIKYLANEQQKIFKVSEFVEKPDLATAKKYVNSGNYLWNSGMFLFKTEAYLQELNKYAPEILHSATQAVNKAGIDLDFIRLDQSEFSNCKKDSIDYAVMEKTDKAMVLPLNVGWNDIGSWTALYEVGQKDKNQNVIKGDVFSQDTFNSYINANHHMVAAIGVKDLIIVDTADATLVAHQDYSQNVKSIVEQLHQQQREEPLTHKKVYRPWGWYNSIDKEAKFQVKRIGVNPGAKLSLQSHKKRAEHWVVVKGVATITRDNQVITLKENQSTYIPIGMKHSLANKTDEILEIIEIQTGEYLGEDDIERYEDIYGRTNQ